MQLGAQPGVGVLNRTTVAATSTALPAAVNPTDTPFLYALLTDTPVEDAEGE